jgi:hypothetical protein
MGVHTDQEAVRILGMSVDDSRKGQVTLRSLRQAGPAAVKPEEAK